MAWSRDQMVQRAAAQLRAGECVSLGRGLPLQVTRWMDPSQVVWLLSENGMLGPSCCLCPEPIDAHEPDATALRQSPVFSAVDVFAIIHGGHVDLAIVEALQVSEQGDLANACTPGNLLDATGYIIDLVAGARRVVVLMEHVTLAGEHKLVSECDLPLIGAGVVSRVITELGVMDVTPHGLQLVELAEGVCLSEISSKTGVALNLVVDERPGFA